MNLKSFIKKKLSIQLKRDQFIISELKKLPQSSSLLDVGCGSQRYRKFCDHLTYFGLDSCEYESDKKKSIRGDNLGLLDKDNKYQYGDTKYICDCWDMHDVNDKSIDTILCTEVFEHIPYPLETVREFSRVLKNGGRLILTLPFASTRHMDPYFFFSGFSDNWVRFALENSGFKKINIIPVGDYYKWMGTEIAKSFNHGSIISKLILLPSLLWHLFHKESNESRNTLCIGYHITAEYE